MNSKETKIFLLLETHKKMICLRSAHDTRSLRDKDDCVVRESGSRDWSVGGVVFVLKSLSSRQQWRCSQSYSDRKERNSSGNRSLTLVTHFVRSGLTTGV